MQMDKFRASVVQMTSTDNKEVNLAVASELLAQASAEGADLAVLPEHFNFIGKKDDVLEQVDPENGPTLEFLKEKASAHKMWIHGGSFFEKGPEENRAYNVSKLINPDGEVFAEYRKIHLFDIQLSSDRAYKESGSTISGSEPVIAETPFGKMGFSICYDLRFPELYRNYAKEKVEIIFAPAAFTLNTGKDHWLCLLKARAVENLAFGKHHPNRASYGKSAVVDPWGTYLAVAPDEPSVITSNIDLKYLKKIRSQLPALDHIKEELF
jgi:predicted amidohydrolase